MTQNKKVQNLLSFLALASGAGHIFCCVLPTVLSFTILMVGIGLIGALPIWIENMHETMHYYEMPILVFSAVVLVLGWGAIYLGKKIDCHDTGCQHGPCEPNKNRSVTILKIATCLFLINISAYTVFHFIHH